MAPSAGAVAPADIRGSRAAPFDLLVIGGGINGAGIARDAAGRGLSVLLCERGDLASGTSSRTSKLVHGGLRYLEHGEFRLVRESLQEREILLRTAPHLVQPLRIVLLLDAAVRSTWRIRAGLWLYDRLAGRRRLAASHAVDLTRAAEGAPLASAMRRGFVYSDCWVDDARLTIACAVDAASRGASILTRTEFVHARRDGNGWRAELAPQGSPASWVYARAIVNVAGPAVSAVAARIDGVRQTRAVRLVKGSHIVVPGLWQGDHAYLVQNGDGRVVFALPFDADKTLVGTTDVVFEGNPAQVSIDDAETDYLLAALARAFARPPGRADVLHSFAGLRPLLDDGAADPSAVTRDYALELDAQAGAAPLLTVYGGKLTTHRRLAESALDRLAPSLSPPRPAWTANAPLPGGDISGSPADYARRLAEHYTWLPPALARRYAYAYGTRSAALLGRASSLDDLGADLCCGLHTREIDYLCREEWACSADDILWRRTKLGLRATPAERSALEEYVAHRQRLRAIQQEDSVVEK